MEGKGVVDATSGLFLAGPRRVGKSTLVKYILPHAKEETGTFTQHYLPHFGALLLYSSESCESRNLKIIGSVNEETRISSGCGLMNDVHYWNGK